MSKTRNLQNKLAGRLNNYSSFRCIIIPSYFNVPGKKSSNTITLQCSFCNYNIPFGIISALDTYGIIRESTYERKMDWSNKESVHTVDDVDIGDIDAVNIDFIVVKRGFVNIYTITIFQSIELKDGMDMFCG